MLLMLLLLFQNSYTISTRGICQKIMLPILWRNRKGYELIEIYLHRILDANIDKGEKGEQQLGNKLWLFWHVLYNLSSLIDSYWKVNLSYIVHKIYNYCSRQNTWSSINDQKWIAQFIILVIKGSESCPCCICRDIYVKWKS